MYIYIKIYIYINTKNKSNVVHVATCSSPIPQFLTGLGHVERTGPQPTVCQHRQLPDLKSASWVSRSTPQLCSFEASNVRKKKRLPSVGSKLRSRKEITSSHKFQDHQEPATFLEGIYEPQKVQISCSLNFPPEMSTFLKLPQKVRSKPSFWTMFGCGGNCFQSSTYPTPPICLQKTFKACPLLLLTLEFYFWKSVCYLFFNNYFKTLWWVVSTHLKKY